MIIQKSGECNNLQKITDIFNEMNYIVYIPNHQNTSELPLMIYLHGAGERGTNVQHIEKWGVPKMIREGREYEAVILCPQCPAQFVWDNIAVELKKLIDEIVKKYNIKNDRISITGSSMGGFGTWMMGLTYRNFFSAIGPVAGGAMSWRCGNLKSTPVFAVHGDGDEVVPIEYSRLCVNVLKALNCKVKFKILEGYGHNDGIDEAYKNKELTDWLLSRRRTDFTYVPEHLEDYF